MKVLVTNACRVDCVGFLVVVVGIPTRESPHGRTMSPEKFLSPTSYLVDSLQGHSFCTSTILCVCNSVVFLLWVVVERNEKGQWS